MLSLKPDECRVLGVLVEKALTTPQQYPLTLNTLTTGCNQKNNRFPITTWDDDRVLDAVDALRAKGLVREAMLSGSRVAKFRHLAREVLEVDTAQLVVLTELFLRGPQSVGDIRQHASRMHPIASLEDTQSVLDGLIARQLVKEHAPPPGSRAKLYSQLYCPTLHKIEARTEGPLDTGEDDASPAAASSAGPSPLAQRVDALEREVQSLRAELTRLREAVGG
jgi:uncharacterized protein